MINPYLVQVLMLTFNHENFIEDAIEGVLMQNTNFNYELIISDDFSVDKTREICLRYKAKYPNKVSLLLNEKNLGANNNAIKLLQKSTSKYIALCEGDDYWTDPLKLQKQVDFLENNPDYALCGHESLVVNFNASPPIKINFSDWRNIKTQNKYTEKEMIKSIYPFQTATCVFRNVINFDEEIQLFFKNVHAMDQIIYLLLAHVGKVYFIDDVMSVYNIRHSGITSKQHGSTLIDAYFHNIDVYKKINAYYNFKHNDAMNDVILFYFDKMMFNKSLYLKKSLYFKDLLIFIFTSKFGKKSFFKKVKYSFLILMKSKKFYLMNK